jgi:transposase
VRHRSLWLDKIGEVGVRRRAEFYYQQLDALRWLRQQVRRDLLIESARHQATKRLRQIPSIGPIRAALLVALLQTPHRFRTKRQLWAYSGFGIETHDSGEHRLVEGELRRSKKKATVRGLNRNYNRDLKNLFKGAATQAAAKPGPLQEFYRALLAKGIRPDMARLTLARKMVAISLTIWKKGVDFDPKPLQRQAA